MRPWFRIGTLLLCWGVVMWLCMWGGGRSAWFLLFGLSAFIAYVFGVKLFALRSVEVIRTLEHDRYSAGDDVMVQVTLRLRTWFPLASFSIDEPWVCNGQICLIHHKTFFLGFARERRYRYVLKQVPRGVYRALDPFVAVSDVFGILSHVHCPPSVLDCTVVPRPIYVVKRGDQWARSEADQMTSDSTVIMPDQIKGLRPYAPGDPINRIHWKASAKGLGLKTMEYEVAADREMLLLLDTNHPSERDLEQAVGLAAGMMKHLHDERTGFGFATLQTKLSLPQERMTWQQGLEQLAAVQLSDSHEGERFDQLLANCGSKVKSHTQVICILSKMDDAFVRAVQMLRYRNLGIHIIWLHQKILHHRDRQWMKELRHLGCELDLVRSTETPLGYEEGVDRVGLPNRSFGS